MSDHILAIHPDTWKMLVSDFEPLIPLDDATIFSLPINRAECDTVEVDDLFIKLRGKPMNLEGYSYHSYPEGGVAGWAGYYHDDNGAVVAWIGTNGEIVPASDIKGGDADQPDSDSPIGDISW